MLGRMLWAASFAAVFLSAGVAKAVDLGLTPSHVYSLWSGTNAVLLDIAQNSGVEGLYGRVESLSAKEFGERTPADVLDKVKIVRDKLNRMRTRAGLPPVTVFGDGSGKVTPSIVYLNSGYVMDGTVEWLIGRTDRDVLVSGHYGLPDVTEKSLGEVLGLVDLADRRVDLLIAALKE